jgi:alpha-galactosidase
MNREVLAIHKDPLFIAGERISNTALGQQVWTRPLENGDIAAVLYNSNNVSVMPIALTWSQLGWSNKDKVLVRDLWANKDLGTYPGGIIHKVNANDVSFVRLSKRV